MYTMLFKYGMIRQNECRAKPQKKVSFFITVGFFLSVSLSKANECFLIAQRDDRKKGELTCRYLLSLSLWFTPFSRALFRPLSVCLFVIAMNFVCTRFEMRSRENCTWKNIRTTDANKAKPIALCQQNIIRFKLSTSCSLRLSFFSHAFSLSYCLSVGWLANIRKALIRLDDQPVIFTTIKTNSEYYERNEQQVNTITTS